MKTTLRIATIAVLAVVLASPAAWAADKKDKNQPAASPSTTAPARIDGEVVAVNPDAGTMTVRMSDGTTHEFHGKAGQHRSRGRHRAGQRHDLAARLAGCGNHADPLRRDGQFRKRP